MKEECEMIRRNKTLDGKHPRILITDEFIKRNRLGLCRTPDQIVEKCKLDDGYSWIPALKDVLVNYLPTHDASQFFNESYAKELESGESSWSVITQTEEAAQDFLDYMVFAWSKALDERGLSAGRSIIKLSSWMWLLGRDDIEATLQDETLYAPYGAPALIKACEELGIEVPDDLREFAKAKQ